MSRSTFSSSKLPFGSYVTHLRTKKLTQPTLYAGEKRFISPEYLQAHVPLGNKKKALPLCHSIAIAYEDSNGTNKVFSFIISRATIDGLVQRLPANESAQIQFVEQYLPLRKSEIFVGNAGAHGDLKSHKSSNHDHSRYFKHDGIFCYSLKRSRNESLSRIPHRCNNAPVTKASLVNSENYVVRFQKAMLSIHNSKAQSRSRSSMMGLIWILFCVRMDESLSVLLLLRQPLYPTPLST